MTEVQCRRCDTELDAKEDEWWSHDWREQPDEQTVEKAIEIEGDGGEFRDWFHEHIVLCPDCHKEFMNLIQNHD